MPPVMPLYCYFSETSSDSEIEEVFDVSELREIGKLAVWSVSSSKPGNGVELLRDGDEKTFWQ